MAKLVNIGRRLPERKRLYPEDRPDWAQANPKEIDRALQRSLEKNGGGWYALGASRGLDRRPMVRTVTGRELVAFRGENGALVVADRACPHMGADLGCGRVECGRLVCPWHGLSLGREGHGRWKPLVAFDDGVLAWVRFETAGETLTDRPMLPVRPTDSLAAVIEMDARAEPSDILANRLDPWHGAHYHPHSFARLEVIDRSDDQITVRVAYRVAGPLTVEVDARFDCPDPRTIAMTIVAGDGVGSVVETHATPMDRGRTRVIEATLATSDRAGFLVAKRASRLIRRFIEARASRLWVEDVAYAERRYALRTKDGEARSRDANERPAHISLPIARRL